MPEEVTIRFSADSKELCDALDMIYAKLSLIQSKCDLLGIKLNAEELNRAIEKIKAHE